MLAKLVPLFDGENVDPEGQEEAVKHLAQRLQGLTAKERAELAAEMSKLAKLSGATKEAAELQQQFQYIVERINAGGDVNMDLAGEGAHMLKDLVAIGKITIRTGPAPE